MVLYQKKNPETAEFVFDKDGAAHEIKDGILTGTIIPKTIFEADWVPLVKQG